MGTTSKWDEEVPADENALGGSPPALLEVAERVGGRDVALCHGVRHDCRSPASKSLLLQNRGVGLRVALGEVPREQKMLTGHLPRLIYHLVY